LEVELPRPLQLSGVTIVGAERPVIPLPKSLPIDLREGADWKTVSQIANATEKTRAGALLSGAVTGLMVGLQPLGV
jgi:hypothetical protein